MTPVYLLSRGNPLDTGYSWCKTALINFEQCLRAQLITAGPSFCESPVFPEHTHLTRSWHFEANASLSSDVRA